ncbi:MAG: hypothetical protein KJ955_02980 [Nanoarchaeota archaeon]|nr:hypothetical protein [Nanoarchaeota archaeon]
MAKQLNLGWQNRKTLDRLLSDYFTMPKPLQFNKDDDYLVLTMPATPQLAMDATKMPGLQARLYQATLNSHSRGDFENFPEGSSVKLGAFDDSTSLLENLQSFKPALDTSGYRKLKLFAGRFCSQFNDFIAELTEKNATLYFHKKMKLEMLKEMLRPFVLDDGNRNLFARYIAIKAAKLK